MSRRDTSGDRRLSSFGADPSPSDPAAPRELEEDVGDLEDDTDEPTPCADCGSEALVEDAAEWSTAFPSKALCRPCARGYL